MRDPLSVGSGPPGGPRPPAPPATGDWGAAPDPADPGPPIRVSLGGLSLGDLGNWSADAGFLTAIVLRDGPVGAWLRAHRVTVDALAPLHADVARTAEEIALAARENAQISELRDLIDRGVSPGGHAVAVQLDRLLLGDLGSTRTDARLLSAILVRGGAITAWLRDRIGDVANVERAFPGSSWT